MGYVVEWRELAELLKEENNKLIVLSANHKGINRYLSEFEIISLGRVLSDKLIRYPKERRNSILIQEMDNILLNNNEIKLFIKDIDILFNPEYKLDVMRYFYGLSRVKKVVLEWNGILNNDYLQYAEVGYLDYKRYSINKYDIICVKQMEG